MLERKDLHSYQDYCVEFIKTHPEAAIFLDLGLGKTAIALTAIQDLIYDSFEVRKVLVIAPLRVARDQWPSELEKMGTFRAYQNVGCSWNCGAAKRSTASQGRCLCDQPGKCILAD